MRLRLSRWVASSEFLLTVGFKVGKVVSTKYTYSYLGMSMVGVVSLSADRELMTQGSIALGETYSFLSRVRAKE